MNSGPRLTLGSTGPDVNRLQIILVMIGLLDIGAVDNIFGSDTQDAVKLFQRRCGILVDGIVGALTWKALPSDPQTHRLALGSRGVAVSALQKGLLAFDGANTPTDPGPIDGDFGLRTELAVREYQARQNMPINGIVDDQTWWASGVSRVTLASLAGLATV